MELTGFNETCACRSGGVRAISLARASAIENVTFDAASRSCTAVSMAEGHRFVPYGFMEGSARLTGKVVREEGGMLVRHRLQFALAGIGARSGEAVGQIAAVSELGGLVALVETGAGERMLVGYSEKSGLQQPLRLVESDSDTGSSRADDARRTVVLESIDCAPALPFTGVLP